MIKRILKAINDHADYVSDLFNGSIPITFRPQLIPIQIVCRDCREPLSTKNMEDHRCLTIHGER